MSVPELLAEGQPISKMRVSSSVGGTGIKESVARLIPRYNAKLWFKQPIGNDRLSKIEWPEELSLNIAARRRQIAPRQFIETAFSALHERGGGVSAEAARFDALHKT